MLYRKSRSDKRFSVIMDEWTRLGIANEKYRIDDSETNKVLLPQKLTYKHGAVTYEVTAHFCSETESLKSKWCRQSIIFAC